MKAVKPGYKETEIGVIPKDWEVKRLEDVTERIGDGIHSTPKYSPNGEIHFINGNNLVNGKIIITNETKKIDRIEYLLHKRSLSHDAILLSINGTIGNLAYYNNKKIILGKSACYINKNKTINRNYLFYSLGSKKIINQFENSLTGTTIKNLGLEAIRKTHIPLPPTLAEQEKIATALSDTDSYIEKLEKLIEKKKYIKTGAMQELLTGKKRLPGFGKGKGTKETEVGVIPEDWEVKKLGEVASIKTGSKNNQDKVSEGKYPFFVRSATVERINSYGYDCEAIIIPGEGGIGSIFHYINGRFDAHQRVYVISNFIESSIGKFIYFKMRYSFGSHAMEYSVKATVDSLRLPTFINFPFSVPPTLAEQERIAIVLSDMDSEIEKLEVKLEKYKDIKQGMMQKLLTGAVRLV